jgi:hypothetical protein
MPGHYSTIVNLDEVVLTNYQQRVFRQAQRLLTERADSGTGETILPDAYVIQKELLTMITDPTATSDGTPAADASRLVNMVLDIEEVEILPTPPSLPTLPDNQILTDSQTLPTNSSSTVGEFATGNQTSTDSI